MASVEIRQLGKVFPNGYRAVNGLDLDIADGEFFVIVGPSGCGKTSVLRMIAGLEEITLGEIRVDGELVNRVPTNTRDLSMLFQSSALYPHLSVRENLGFPLQMARVRRSEIRTRVDAVAEMLGLTGVLDSRPSQLSGGQRQRVAMGRAVVRRPGLLLMDEPMSNLDAKLRTELRAELHLMQRRLDVTTVYVTHDQVEAMSLGDRVAVMRRGRIVQCAPPQHLYRHPRDVFVAQFVGSPAMNLLRGALVRDDAGLAALTGTYRIPLDGASWRWPDLDRHVGHEVIVGIRPESFLPDPEGELVLSVLRVESLGAAELVHAQVDAPVHHESEVVADGGDAADGVIGDEDDVAAGDTGEVEQIVVALEGHAATGLWRPLRLRVATDEIQLFDPATGEALPAIDR